MSKIELYKLNQDDILEILTEYLAQLNGLDTFSSKAIIIGTPNKDLRVITAVGELEEENLYSLDLEEVDRKIDFNGSHANTKGVNPEDFINIDFEDF